MATKRTLVLEVDVTDWTDEQIQSLDMHLAVQLEAAEDGSYPDAENATSRIVDRVYDPRGLKRPVAKVTILSGAPDEVVCPAPVLK